MGAGVLRLKYWPKLSTDSLPWIALYRFGSRPSSGVHKRSILPLELPQALSRCRVFHVRHPIVIECGCSYSMIAQVACVWLDFWPSWLS